MLHRLVAILVFAVFFLPWAARADSWTDGQAQWARHGSKHGAWDCDGNCPSGPAAPPMPRQRVSRPSFDGAWMVSADGPCSGAGTSQVLISGGRIVGQNGGGGHVSPSGIVDTIANIDGVTVIGQGRIHGRTASGVYRQSDGCSSSWSAVKL